MGDGPVVVIAPRHLTAVVALLVLTAIGALALVQHGGRHSAVQGSGIPATQTRSVGEFDGVELAGSNTVAITIGTPRRVVVRADTNLLSHVTTWVRGGRLIIGDTPGSFAAVTPMSVAVTVPSVSDLTLTGSGSISVAGGSTSTLDAVIAGSGNLRAGGLTARDVHAAISGSGSIVVTATHTLEATIAGSGTVMYAGHPLHVTTNVTGSGSVVPF